MISIHVRRTRLETDCLQWLRYGLVCECAAMASTDDCCWWCCLREKTKINYHSIRLRVCGCCLAFEHLVFCNWIFVDDHNKHTAPHITCAELNEFVCQTMMSGVEVGDEPKSPHKTHWIIALKFMLNGLCSSTFDIFDAIAADYELGKVTQLYRPQNAKTTKPIIRRRTQMVKTLDSFNDRKEHIPHNAKCAQISLHGINVLSFLDIDIVVTLSVSKCRSA